MGKTSIAALVSSIVVVALIISSIAIVHNPFQHTGKVQNIMPKFNVYDQNSSSNYTVNFTQNGTVLPLFLVGPAVAQAYLVSFPTNNSSIRLHVLGGLDYNPVAKHITVELNVSVSGKMVGGLDPSNFTIQLTSSGTNGANQSICGLNFGNEPKSNITYQSGSSGVIGFGSASWVFRTINRPNGTESYNFSYYALVTYIFNPLYPSTHTCTIQAEIEGLSKNVSTSVSLSFIQEGLT